MTVVVSPCTSTSPVSRILTPGQVGQDPGGQVRQALVRAHQVQVNIRNNLEYGKPGPASGGAGRSHTPWIPLPRWLPVAVPPEPS